MANTKTTKPPILCPRSLEQLYYFIKFENDVQVAFDEVSAIRNTDRVSINLIKGNIYLKGDYFIPLKSSDLFQLNCDELLQILKRVACIRTVEVDSKYNLTFCLQRQIVYKSTLLEVLNYSNKYGMAEWNKSVLVLVDRTEKEKTFNDMRNSLLAEHIISILVFNNIKVYCSDVEFDFKSENSSLKKLLCSDTCIVDDICKQLTEKAKLSEWRSKSEVNDNLCVDAKKYVEVNCLTEKYGKSLNGIIVSEGNPTSDLRRAAYVTHLIEEHICEAPDYILHIANQGKSTSIFNTGILLGMFDKLKSKELLIFTQSVQSSKNDFTHFSPEDFILAHKQEIDKAMAHKYDTYTPHNKMWSSRVDSLVDTAVKFEFLRLNPNSILRLQSPWDRGGGKNFGVFIQYNYARLSNLFKNFETKVAEGYYSALLSIEEVDFNLLKVEEEWNLFHYVLSFPQLVQGVLESLLSDECSRTRYRLNRICLMLQELCQYLSLYYSRIRILSGPQPHLQRTMNARLWLLKGIHQVFKSTFGLLNVMGLDQM